MSWIAQKQLDSAVALFRVLKSRSKMFIVFNFALKSFRPVPICVYATASSHLVIQYLHGCI